MNLFKMMMYNIGIIGIPTYKSKYCKLQFSKTRIKKKNKGKGCNHNMLGESHCIFGTRATRVCVLRITNSSESILIHTKYIV